MGEFDSIGDVLDFAIDKEIEANRLYIGLAGRKVENKIR